MISALLAPVVTWFSKTLWLYLGRDVRTAVVRFFTKRRREHRRRRREQEAQR
ncbi:hypothetical protein [Myxococcus faecalis]|uniref:hypothetical protein n=1 Tax=Myxococcus faecalis TaxID=3115646 RepID=UPI003CE95CE7